MIGAGGLNGALVDPVLTQVANATANAEVPLNLLLIVVFFALGAGMLWSRDTYLRQFLIASIVVSALIWYFTQAFGMIFTGMATDFNSGLLLIVMALGVWPRLQVSGQKVPALPASPPSSQSQAGGITSAQKG